jgi:hypothetical protein
MDGGGYVRILRICLLQKRRHDAGQKTTHKGMGDVEWEKKDMTKEKETR